MANKNFILLNVFRVLILLGSAAALSCHVANVLLDPNPGSQNLPWTSSSSKYFIPYILYFTAGGISLFSVLITLLGACCNNRSVSADKSLGLTNVCLWIGAVVYG